MESTYAGINKRLIKRLIKGDESTFKKVYDLYYDKLYFYCLKFVKSEDLARELLQDIFVKFWTNREKINPDLSLNAYLYKIARNHSLDWLKKTARDQQLKEALMSSMTFVHSQVEDNLVYAEYDAAANEAIRRLPSQRRVIFQLSRNDGMSYKEIAEALGISKHTVKVQIFRASKAVREYLQIHTDLTFVIMICSSLLILSLS